MTSTQKETINTWASIQHRLVNDSDLS